MRFLLALITLLGQSSSVSGFAPINHHQITNTALSAHGGKLSVRPIGIGSAAPSTVITNTDLESVHDTTDEWIRTRTGIEERRVLIHEGTRQIISSDTGETTETPETLRALGIEAAKSALEMSGQLSSKISTPSPSSSGSNTLTRSDLQPYPSRISVSMSTEV